MPVKKIPSTKYNIIKQKYMTKESVAQNTKHQLNSSTENEKTEKLKKKLMHGQFYWDFERSSVDKEKSLAWLCNSGIKGETEFDNSSPRSSASICVIIRRTS
jgi:hypothetical protein